MQKLINRNYHPVEEHLYSALTDIRGAAYDNTAKAYERLVSSKTYNRLIWGTTPEDYSNFATKAILQSEGTVIDIGCGGLTQTVSVYSKTSRDILLLDHSIEMLKLAKSRLNSHCSDFPHNIRLLQANAFDLPFDSESVDTVCSFGLIHCFEEKQAFVNEVLRILKKGGSFYFSSMTTDRAISKYYMKLLRIEKAFGEPFSSEQVLALFDAQPVELEHYMKGSMLFMSGRKIK